MSDSAKGPKTILDRWEEAHEDERENMLHEIAASLTLEEAHHFADILASTLKEGTLIVTGWTREAVKSALVVCSEKNLSISFKNGERTIAPVTYPKEGPMLEMFVNAIMTGEWS